MQKSARSPGQNRLLAAGERASSRRAERAAPLAAMGLGLTLTAALLGSAWGAVAGLAAAALALIHSRRQQRAANRPCPALQPTVFAGTIEDLASGSRR